MKIKDLGVIIPKYQVDDGHGVVKIVDKCVWN